MARRRDDKAGVRPAGARGHGGRPATQAPPIPLVGFDEQGYRLGYGGGCFDRTLATQAVRPLAVGVGFEPARLPTIHPQVYMWQWISS